jgi:hypothetical protein
MIRTLERPPNPEDAHDAANDGDAEFQLKPEFHMPAASKWVEHNGNKLYSRLGELKNWDKRLLEIAEGAGIDESTRDVARGTAQRMREISATTLY